jgi:SAM-dependent methyltransferase
LGAGEYEVIAGELEPVAEHVVALASLSPGEGVVDIACGTGNAALLAARAGAVVTGVDGVPRLIDVAAGRAARERLPVTFVVGDLHELPFEDRAFDVALSVFGVVFARDPVGAVAELVRVLAPGGRALVTSWIPEGPVDAAIGVLMRAVACAVGPMPPRFPWHERDAVAELVARAGAKVTFEDASVSVTAGSLEEYFARGAVHPMTVSFQPLLERAGTYDEVRRGMLAAFREGNEDPDAFRITSRYRIGKIIRPA